MKANTSHQDALRRALTPPATENPPRLPSNFNYLLMQRIAEVERKRRRRDRRIEVVLVMLFAVLVILTIVGYSYFFDMKECLNDFLQLDLSSPQLWTIPLCFICFPFFNRMTDKWLQR